MFEDHQPVSAGDFARRVQDFGGELERLQAGVDLVTQMITASDHAGVTISLSRILTTAAATDDLARQSESRQYEADQGPALDATQGQRAVISQDLARESRWPAWTAQIAATGIRSVLSLQLYTLHESLGALSLYSHRSDAWPTETVGAARSVAGQLAAALADARELDYQAREIGNRTVTGQAQGMIMEHYGVGPDRAMEYLRRLSQDGNSTISSTAADIVSSRRVPVIDEDDCRWHHA